MNEPDNVAYAGWRADEPVTNTGLGNQDPWARFDPPGPAALEPESYTTLRFRSLAEVAADVDSRAPRKFLFERVMVAGDYGVLSAEDKAGKTFSGLDAVVSCAAGLPWLGHFTCQSPGPAVAFLGEGSDAKMLRRIRAIGEHKGLTRDQVDALPIRLCLRVPFLSDQAHLVQIAAELGEHPVNLVLLDPLYLAAKGGKGSDLYAMGEMLGNVQRVVQPRGATLIINHHWNKTGDGSGHARSSGVGPGAWGRFLISVGVKSNHTDPVTQATTVRTVWSVKGDEIADNMAAFVRKVWVDDPDDLNSPMHYSVELDADPEPAQDDAGPDLAPAARKILEALGQGVEPIDRKTIVDRIAAKHGHGLARETVSRELNRLLDLGLVDRIDEGPGKSDLWLLAAV